MSPGVPDPGSLGAGGKHSGLVAAARPHPRAGPAGWLGGSVGIARALGPARAARRAGTAGAGRRARGAAAGTGMRYPRGGRWRRKWRIAASPGRGQRRGLGRPRAPRGSAFGDQVVGGTAGIGARLPCAPRAG